MTSGLAAFHGKAGCGLHQAVSDLTNYENFLKATNKSTKGWWYGFKMSGICNDQGDLENIIFSYANIADCKIAEKLAECVKGTIFADAGYLQSPATLSTEASSNLIGGAH